MKKSFYLVAVLCLFGNVAYALDVKSLQDVAKNNPAIHSESVTAYEAALATKVGSKKLKVIRSLSLRQSIFVSIGKIKKSKIFLSIVS